MTTRAEPSQDSLQHKLDEITANTRALVPPERLAGTERLVAELAATGLQAGLLSPGTIAPSFELTSAHGKRVRSADLCALGFVVLKFFRGRWDPYDMTELETWQDLQPTLRQFRALLVGICPQTPRQNAFTADRHHLTFPLLSDPACAVAQQYGIAYTVPAASQPYYRSMLVNIPFLNGDETWRLPLPATYVLNAQSEVIFAQAFADHRVRPEPQEVIDALRLAASATSAPQ